jgi:hypothetical protein
MNTILPLFDSLKKGTNYLVKGTNYLAKGKKFPLFLGKNLFLKKIMFAK